VIGNATDAWRLGERQGTSVGEVAYEVFGQGPPVVLVHGTPTRSYLWRNIVPALAEHGSVHVYDLLGYGESEKGEGQDVSIAAQARLLKELVEAWGLEEPAIAGHDIGGGIVLRAQLLEGLRFSRVAILDAVVLGPSTTVVNSMIVWHHVLSDEGGRDAADGGSEDGEVVDRGAGGSERMPLGAFRPLRGA
jgi:pimeloyl-ACP methyl ester carboxylesterase